MSTIPHDERLLQLLSALLIELNTLQRSVQQRTAASAAPDMEEVSARLRVLAQLAHEALAEVRSAAEEQSPAELEGMTLPEVLSQLTEESAERLGISSRIAIAGVDEQGHPRNQQTPLHTLTPMAERLLLLLTRETLYEIEQRPETHRLRLAFSYGDEEVQLTIEDDGHNPPLASTREEALAPPFAADNQRGESATASQTLTPIIQDLRQRFMQLGGGLDIQTLSQRGRRVQAHLPYTTYSHNGHETAVVVATRPLPVVPAPATLQSANLRILIVESQAVTRAGLRRLLESYEGLQVVGEAADGMQAASETVELGPQVVLMDAQLPEGQTLSTLRQIKQLNPDVHILLLATQDREEYLYEALRAGADGYVLKDIEPDEVIQAIRTIARGEVLISPRIANRLLGRQRRGNHSTALTARELEVLQLLVRGLRNKEIAARLYVSERTVNFHLANIYQKLNASGRTEALSKALEQGLIAP